VEVLCYFNCTGKKQDPAGGCDNWRINKAFYRAIDENNHQQVATIRPNPGIVQIFGNTKLNGKQNDSRCEI
jgi:hypothetical protein